MKHVEIHPDGDIQVVQSRNHFAFTPISTKGKEWISKQNTNMNNSYPPPYLSPGGVLYTNLLSHFRFLVSQANFDDIKIMGMPS